VRNLFFHSYPGCFSFDKLRVVGFFHFARKLCKSHVTDEKVAAGDIRPGFSASPQDVFVKLGNLAILGLTLPGENGKIVISS
jgi:hypothetical protein